MKVNRPIGRPDDETVTASTTPKAAGMVSEMAARMRDEIRATLHSDLRESSQRIDHLVRGVEQEKEQLPVVSGPGNDAPSPTDDESVLVGVWRGGSQMNGMACTSETIFKADGGYSSMSVCAGVYAVQIVGSWSLLQEGAVRLEYTDFTPKEWGETQILVQSGETIYFRVINQNQIETNWGTFNRAE